MADFPELLPHERFGLGGLIILAREFPCAAGYIDPLLVDGFGRLVVCEVKKGAENSDIHSVIAQMLDYGAALWRLDVDVFQLEVGRCEPRSGETLAGTMTANSVPSPNRRRSGSAWRFFTDSNFVFL